MRFSNFKPAEITQNELDPVNEYLAQKGIQVSEFYPTIRGRVNAVNGEAVARRAAHSNKLGPA